MSDQVRSVFSPGRELDARIAEKVMGRPTVWIVTFSVNPIDKTSRQGREPHFDAGEGRLGDDVPAYSTNDIAAAAVQVRVAELLGKRELSWIISSTGGRFRCQIGGPAGIHADGVSGPHAICMVALAVAESLAASQ